MVGVAILALLTLAFVIWFLGSHPKVSDPTDTATTTPASQLEPAHIVEDAAYYEIDAAYPTATPLTAISAEADAAAVAAMKSFTVQAIAEFKANGNFSNLSPDDVQLLRLDQRKYSLGMTYETKTGPRTITYIYIRIADTGGAHPNSFYKTFTFDTVTGEEVTLGDLFLPGSGYLDRLSSIARADLPTVIDEYADAGFIEEGTSPSAESFQNFYLEGSTLVLLFPPYQVGPYSLGTVRLPIELARLTSILKTEYR